jgi:hypothetical protein
VSPVAEMLIFEGSYCESVSYFVRVPSEEFDVAGFRTKTETSPDKNNDEWHSVTCAPKDQKADFHLHVQWRTRASSKIPSFEMRIAFVKGSKQPAVDEHEPYAEQFMQWLEPFFIEKHPESHIHAAFEVPKEVGRSRYPLPLKIQLGPDGAEAEIDGISFTLKSAQQGIFNIWLTQKESNTQVNMIADARLDFVNFDVRQQINEFGKVLDSILEPKK